VWTAGTAVTARIVDATPSELESACRRFLRLCAAPNSSAVEIRQLGNRLYRWLIAPELARNPDATTYLRADSWLASIPFAALVDNEGRYIGMDHSFVSLVGLEQKAEPQVDAVSADSPTLVVSVPKGEAPGQRSLPFLKSAELEAADMAGRFRHAVLLKDRQADPETMASFSSHCRLFHFCGHGWVNGGDGALVLAPALDGSPRIETFREIASQDWRQCSLAVLSACLTAAGEDAGPSVIRAWCAPCCRRAPGK
jgi:CHAT domain-containing protein